LSVFGDGQVLNAFLSSLHWKLATGSSELNLNVILFLSVFFGAPLVIFVSGASSPIPSPSASASSLAATLTRRAGWEGSL
jgi:hypothetical protein